MDLRLSAVQTRPEPPRHRRQPELLPHHRIVNYRGKHSLHSNMSVINASSENISSTNPKIQRTISRFQAKIDDKEYYEAHQTLRSLINRSAKAHKIDEAIDLIYFGSLILISSDQFASAGDLLNYLLEILNGNKIESDKAILGKLLTILSKFPVQEPSFNKISLEVIGWSSKYSEYKFGHPQLHDLIGMKYLNNDKIEDLNKNYSQAQNHLILGTSASFTPLVDLTWNWYSDDQQIENLPKYLIFPIVNYLILKNIKSAKQFLVAFLELYFKHNSAESLPYKNIKIDDFYHVYEFEKPEHFILNFVQLAILTIQSNNKDFFIKLKSAYEGDINRNNLALGVGKLGLIYFDLQVPKQVNFLQEMMGGFFK